MAETAMTWPKPKPPNMARVFENRGNLFRITEFRKWTKKSAPKIREFRKLTTICTVKTIFLFLVIIHNECVALNEYNCKNPEH